MIYGYSRVSSVKQMNEGNSLADQEAILKSNGAEEIIWEQFTGKTTERPKLQELISTLKAGDTLLVTKLDRLARSTREGIDTIDELIAKGVTVRVLNMGTIEDTPVGRLIRTVLLAMAEFERDMILERTKSGKEIARQRPGFKDGRPAIGGARLEEAMQLLKDHSYKQVENITGISQATLYRNARKRKLAAMGSVDSL